MSEPVLAEHDLLALALRWHRDGRKVAVATVIQTWGSAPRAVGSQLIIDETGAMEGSVSGGCVEGAVIAEALDSMEDGAARVLHYGVSDNDAFAVGLACGGDIRVLVEPVGGSMKEDHLVALVEAKQNAAPIAYVASLSGETRRLASSDEFEDRFRLDRSGIEEDGDTFVAIHNPPLRLIIVGAVHIAQPLVGMARGCGFQPILIDPRDAFGSAARFPGETIINEWPDEAMEALRPDARTAVVTLTHDPKLDDPAIAAALNAPIFYLGCLGSKRTHAKRVDRLKESGFDDQAIARIHAPVGLDLGGRKPAEIAVSIMAEIIATLRKAQ